MSYKHLFLILTLTLSSCTVDPGTSYKNRVRGRKAQDVTDSKIMVLFDQKANVETDSIIQYTYFKEHTPNSAIYQYTDGGYYGFVINQGDVIFLTAPSSSPSGINFTASAPKWQLIPE